MYIAYFIYIAQIFTFKIFSLSLLATLTKNIDEWCYTREISVQSDAHLDDNVNPAIPCTTN